MDKEKIDRIIARNKANRETFLERLKESDVPVGDEEQEIVPEVEEPVQDDLPVIEA